MEPLVQAAPARQDLGKYLDIATAPQPQGLSGPMAQGHLMTIGVRGVDLIRSQVLRLACTKCRLAVPVCVSGRCGSY